MFKSPPRSQIGQNVHGSSGKIEKPGAGTTNLMKAKGVHIGGGGVITRVSSMAVSFQARQESKRDSAAQSSSQNQPQSILPAALFPFD